LDRKRNLFDRRLARFRGDVKRGESPSHVANAAEKLRLAALALIKAKRALIREYPERDQDGRQSRNLLDEELRWLSLPAEAIIEERGKDDRSHDGIDTKPATDFG
jgi:hypothetical protein